MPVLLALPHESPRTLAAHTGNRNEGWPAKPVQQLLSELKDAQIYQVKFAAKDYTVEVQLLENTDQSIHVSVAVNDETLPAPFRTGSGGD